MVQARLWCSAALDRCNSFLFRCDI